MEHFGYVPPAHVALGRRVTYCKRYGRYRTVQLDAYGYYVPFLQQLTALLCMPEVQNCLQARLLSDYHFDVCDGNYLRSHPF